MHIQQRNIRLYFTVETDRRFTVACFADDFYRWLVRQDMAQSDADEFVIVHDQNSDHDLPLFL